ncbi:MAG: hypothetical protein WCL03_05990, partial [Bacteroidota bacterium]
MKNLYKLKSVLVLLLLVLAGFTGKGQTVTTDNVNSIATTYAFVGATATGAGTYERGVFYSLSANPSVTGTKVVDASGTGPGTFEVEITGLSANTKYYVCAYVMNGVTVVPGSDLSFTTFTLTTFPYSCKAMNDVMIDATTYQFDIFIYSTNASNLL